MEKNSKISLISNVIWVDPLIDNAENSKYLKDLESYSYLKVKPFKTVENAIDEIKKIKFQETNVILSGKLYFEFVDQFKENIKDINIIPKFFIFSKHIDKLEYNKIDDPFYISGGINDNFKEIKKDILAHFKGINSDIENEGQLTVEYIDIKEKLLFNIFFKSLIDETHYDEILKFNKMIDMKYSKESKNFKKLLKLIETTGNIPFELLSKYYARMYTAESYNDDNIFHLNMNNDLRENKHNIYLPYIKTLYEGLKLKSLPLASNQTLYRGAFLSEIEIVKIKNYFDNKNKNNGLLGAFVFSKEFLTFYKEKKNVENFFQNINDSNKSFNKVLFVLEKNNNIDYNLSTHIDIEKISFENDKKVLFLPFSSFEINEIKEININNKKVYEIKLSYLEKNLKEFDNSISNNENIIPETEFKKQIIQSGLIKPEQVTNYKNLIIKYKQYRNQINNTNQINKDNNQINKHQINDKNQNINNSQISAKTTIVKKKKNNKLNNNQDNYITGVLNITKDDINKKIQIINSYNDLKRKGNLDLRNENYSDEDDYKRDNENEIKENCEIQINGKKCPFTYIFKFKNAEKYQIKYIFKNHLTKLDYMFYNCDSLIDLDFSNFNTENVTNMEYMFFYCTSLTNLNISNFNTKKVTNMKSMFYKCSSLSSLNLSNFNTENVTNMENMFSNCESLQALNLSNFNTKNVTKMSSMFYWCDKLTYLNVQNFNTLNVTDMESMFSSCHSLNNLNLSNFNTQNVTDMKNMFSDCYSLKKVNISNFNTQNVTDMECMFNSCSSLQNLDISNFNTQNVTNMGSMFCNSKSLTNLDLSNFNTQNVTNMYSMFAKCESLKEINLSSFTSKNAEIDSMFEGCKSLKKIKTNDAEIINEYNKKK